MENSDDKKNKGKGNKSNAGADDEEEDIEVEAEMEDDDDGDNKKKKGKGKGKSKNPGKKIRLIKINKKKDINEKDADTIDTYNARREFSNLTNMVSYFIQIPYLVDIEFSQLFANFPQVILSLTISSFSSRKVSYLSSDAQF